MKLSNVWKFTTGDNLDYAKPDFNDTDWENIRVDKNWNYQGYKKYYGFAWYRLHVVIPSSLKENSTIKDSLVFNLGKIDDFDQVFLNGKLIGENTQSSQPGSEVKDSFKELENSLWNKRRRYVIPSNSEIIKWDSENIIAIRVYDWGGLGGMFSGDLNIKFAEIQDYLKFVMNRATFEKKGDRFIKNISYKNTSNDYTINCKLHIELKDNINDNILFKKDLDINLPPNSSENYSFDFIKPAESSTLDFRFVFPNGDIISTDEIVPYILTPKEKKEPNITGALIYGERPDRPFLYKISATGARPMTFKAQNLPKGLIIDNKTGIITGKVAEKGKYNVEISAQNDYGKSSKTLEIVIGKDLALTPPMGWNSWNCWGLSVNQQKIYDAAKAFIDYGLANHGWTYINIDDGWEIFGKSKAPKRDKNGKILTNEKFPNIKKLASDIHKLGLKIGIYSSPGDLTCGGYTGSMNHEKQDAQSFADWGIDYLKYDLCGYRKIMKNQNDPKELIPPYKLMGEILQNLNRDIIYSICEYGYGKVWEWSEKVGGQLWRTTGDIWDNWDRVYQIGFKNPEIAKYAKPGHWNDVDMLVIGWVGWGENLHKTLLSPDEQYSHVSLWALLSAPLLLGNDLTKLDDFTLNLITNDEVIAIDQDKKGMQAKRIIKTDDIEVWKKELANGDIALGIFNIGSKTATYKLLLDKIPLPSKLHIRDIWKQEDLGEFIDFYQTTIPSHGVKLIRIIK